MGVYIHAVPSLASFFFSPTKGGGGCFCVVRNLASIFSQIMVGGGYLNTETMKVTLNCLKWKEIMLSHFG